MQFGIQMYTLRRFMTNREDFAQTLRRVAELGYSNVQISKPGFVTYPEMQTMLAENGLKADSAICGVYDIPQSLDEIEAAAQVLGTDVLRTDSIRVEDRFSVAGYSDFAAHLNRCGKALAERGLKFMYHFHSFEFIQLGDTRGIDVLLQETDPAYVMFQPDVFWLTAAGTEPSESLNMFAGRVKYMHLKDYVIVPANTAELETIQWASAPVGTGNLNWDGILTTARKLGIDNFVVEDDMGIVDPFESARQSIENMKKWGF